MRLLQQLLAYGSLIVIVLLMAAILIFLLAYTSSWLFFATLLVFIYTAMDMVRKLKGKPKV
jgi:hypothetical protein